MDSRLARQLLLFSLPFFILTTPCFAYKEQAPRAAPPLTKFALQAQLSTDHTSALALEPELTALGASTVNLTKLNLTSFTPAHWLVNGVDLFTPVSNRYQLHVELKPSGPLHEGNQRLSAYPSLQLTPQSSFGLSFNHFSPRFNIERAGLQTSLHFRTDGIKLNFRPTAISTRLEFDLKITDDESRFDLTYRY